MISQTSSKSSLYHVAELNVAMIFMSTSGALGRYITLDVPATICLRCVTGSIFLGLLCRLRGVSLVISSRDIFKFWGLAVLMSASWITYFISLQKSNVAVAMLAHFTYPIFIAFLEPIFLKSRFQPAHLLFALLGLFGVSLLAPSFSLDDQVFQGLLFGILSAFIYSFRNIVMKKQVARYSGMTLMFYQMVMSAVLLSPALFYYDLQPLGEMWPYVLALGIIGTAGGHTMFVMAMRHFSITSLSILSTIQPIYGILIAMMFLGETPVLRSILGGTIILATVTLEAIRHSRSR
ncbi:MAG: DMT family transporter [Bacteroidota bacterium]